MNRTTYSTNIAANVTQLYVRHIEVFCNGEGMLELTQADSSDNDSIRAPYIHSFDGVLSVDFFFGILHYLHC